MRIGSYEVSVVSDGSYRLDGGSMFGIVPKLLWQRQHPADADNRIEIALNCLLVHGMGRNILIDTGMGDGWSEKELAIYGLKRPDGGLIENLERTGLRREDISDVILTHLHFDHAGGALQFDEGGAPPRPRFPNATYWLQQANLRWAESPSERDRASYRVERWEALFDDEDRLRLLEGNTELWPGVSVQVVNGHTPGQQLVLIGPSDGPRLCYCADLIPMASHVHLPYIMSFDLNPLITLKEKRDLLVRAVTDDWTLIFEHDPQIVAAKVEATLGRFRLAEEVSL
jgi:glyoxylase-like metal-dependent hydrolase (beta-lactamase superfamily II)